MRQDIFKELIKSVVGETDHKNRLGVIPLMKSFMKDLSRFNTDIGLTCAWGALDE